MLPPKIRNRYYGPSRLWIAVRRFGLALVVVEILAAMALLGCKPSPRDVKWEYVFVDARGSSDPAIEVCADGSVASFSASYVVVLGDESEPMTDYQRGLADEFWGRERERIVGHADRMESGPQP